MKSIKNIVLLGATGSIGTQTLDVISKHSDKLKLEAAVAYSSKEKLENIATEFSINKTILVKDEKSEEEANKKIVDLIQSSSVDIVVNAMSGAVGLQASCSALEAGKTLALANKESLVVGGELIMPMAKSLHDKTGEIKLLPIDSEHGAIFQCLIGEQHKEIYKLHITASGGPFFGKNIDELKHVTKDEALAHPTWNMGPKITIDSSTLMNKGLEVIEAHHLFDVPYNKINVVVQRQSAIHSMVEFADGSVKAHLGTTDMRIPIQYALSYPQRWDTPVVRMNFADLKSLDFDKPDCETFKCLKLAFEAGQTGGLLPCVMNAANEVAVAKFLNGEINFLDIPNIIESSMGEAQKSYLGKNNKVESLEQLKEVDYNTRIYAQKV